MSSLKQAVNDHVYEILRIHSHRRVTRPKVIHDTVLGTNVFEAHEIAILDLPLLQRLRRICQVDVVSLVFPSSNHNRFEHTLGVSVIADKMVHSLARKTDLIDRDFDSKHVRLAAIMHDCGHGPFSHMSEQIYRDFEDIKQEQSENIELEHANPHEILSYLIVTSDPFREYCEKIIKTNYHIEFDLDLIGNMIVGNTNNKKFYGKAYLIDIINGAFDADKLDYIQRDSHFTGLKMVLDLDRLFHTIDIQKIEDKNRLILDMGGVMTLEQIIFNKMMLFSTVYHHQKVRAAECLFSSIFYDKRNEFKSASGFLKMTDDDVYCYARGDDGSLASKFARDLCSRNLPKRALVVSTRTSGQKFNYLREAMDRCDNREDAEEIIKLISSRTKEMGQEVSPDLIWMDFRSGPKFKEAMLCPVKHIGDDTDYTTLRHIFPIDAWTRAFGENKWQGYIYTVPEHRKVVQDAAYEIFCELFDLQLNDLSRTLCKMDEDEGETVVFDE